MLSKAKAKFLRALQQKKYRQKYHKFTVEGLKVCDEILREKQIGIDDIFATSDWLEKNRERLPAGTQVHEVTERELASVSNFKTPQEVLFCCTIPEIEVDPSAYKHGWTLYLDGIRDPGNLGTIFRIADWFGIGAVWMSPDCVDLYHPRVIQASMGSVLRQPSRIVPHKEVQEMFEDTAMWASDTDGENIFSTPVPDSGVLIIGNEGTGISKAMLKYSTSRVSIPGLYSRGAESLNAAVATSVMLTRILYKDMKG